MRLNNYDNYVVEPLSDRIIISVTKRGSRGTARAAKSLRWSV